MDIGNFETRKRSEEGVEIELLDIRTRKGTGAFIKVHGIDSDAFLEARATQSRAIAERVESGLKTDPKSLEEAKDEMLAACTIGWRGLEHRNGSGELLPLPFSREAALELYRNYPAIKDQINIAIGDRANFVGA